MCNICDTFNFGLVGVEDFWENGDYTIVFVGGGKRIKFDSENSFKFCPAYGKKLTEENFKSKY